MQEILTEEKVSEIILARYEAEGYHKQTEEEKKRAEEFRKEILEFEKKMANEIV